MSLVLISTELRQGLEAGLDMMFNPECAAACRELGIPPITFNWSREKGQPRNVFIGDRSFDELIAVESPDFPACTWWTGAGRDLNESKPRRFSGVIGVGWRFFLGREGRSTKGLVEAREACEAALGAVVVQMNFDHITYQKDLSWGDPVQVQWLDQDNKHKGIVVQVQYNATFGVNV